MKKFNDNGLFLVQILCVVHYRGGMDMVWALCKICKPAEAVVHSTVASELVASEQQGSW